MGQQIVSVVALLRRCHPRRSAAGGKIRIPSEGSSKSLRRTGRQDRSRTICLGSRWDGWWPCHVSATGFEGPEEDKDHTTLPSNGGVQHQNQICLPPAYQQSRLKWHVKHQRYFSFLTNLVCGPKQIPRVTPHGTISKSNPG
jgi:hypothetical protein